MYVVWTTRLASVSPACLQRSVHRRRLNHLAEMKTLFYSEFQSIKKTNKV